MKKQRFIISAILVLIYLSAKIFAGDLEIGKTAPDFSLKGLDNQIFTLSDYSEQIVVLEWINYGCPFVKKHYKSGNMQKLQKIYTEQDVIWLAICSSAEGKQGNYYPEKIKEISEDYGASFTDYLNDEDGKVGKMYSAKTTPHMFIINKGILEYAGGIDDIKSIDVDDIPKAVNYVDEALNSITEGDEVKTKVSAPYGCSVKYK